MALSSITVFVSLLFLLLPATGAAAPSTEKVLIQTRDGVVISALFGAPATGKPTVVMMHGVGANKEEWTPLIDKLRAEKWGVLAFDARGHGQTTGTDSYQTFTQGPQSQWGKMPNDVGALMGFLKDKKIKRSDVILIGASLGANVMANYAAVTSPVKAVVLLSPGKNYQQVELTEFQIKAVNVPLLIVVSPGDVYSFQSVKELKSRVLPLQVWADVKPGHGVQMFDENLLTRLFQWMSSQK